MVPLFRPDQASISADYAAIGESVASTVHFAACGQLLLSAGGKLCQK